MLEFPIWFDFLFNVLVIFASGAFLIFFPFIPGMLDDLSRRG